MYVIVSVLLFSLTYARNCRTVTKKCPIGELNWKSRAKQFDCLNEIGKYTCLRDDENNLVETCVETVLISKGVVGCPYVLLCKNNLAVIGLDENFHDCPTDNTGCPPKNHTGYALHEIYKYPACSKFDSSKVAKETTDIQDTESSRRKTPWIPVIAFIGTVTVVSVSVGIILYLRRKNVKCPCCGLTKQSENMELGTERSLLRGDEAKADGSDDKGFRGENIQSDVRQFDNEMKDAIESLDTGRIMEKLDEWKKEPVRIGLVGPSMVGKSSFINTMLGTSTSNKAKIGLGNTCSIPKVYCHPKYKGLQFWELPGYGTPRFKLNETYLQDMKVQHYDFLLIFYSSAISEMDIKLVFHLLEAERKFAMVKTRADDFNLPYMKHKPFDDWVSEAKTKCRSTLIEEGIQKEVPIFVISNVTPRLGDYGKLINFLAENTPEIKRMNIFLTINRQTSELINNKESQLAERAWKAAVAIGISAALPIPGIELAFNKTLLEKEIMFYIEAFKLDEESLKEHPNHSVEQLKTCNKILKDGQSKFIIDGISKCFAYSNVGNVIEIALPIFGGIVHGTASTYYMYNFLKTVIADLAEDARTLIKLQTDSLL